MKKRLTILISLLLVAMLSFFILWQSESKSEVKEHPQKVKSEPTPPSITIVAVGDLMPWSSYNPVGPKPSDNGIHLFDEVRQYIKSADLAFCNLEGPVYDGEGNPKPESATGATYWFRIPESLLPSLYDAGFNLFNIANNHLNDMGRQGVLSTEGLLSQAGKNFAGSLKHRTCKFEKNGIKIGFTGFAPYEYANDLRDSILADSVIRELKKVCDLVIVSMHIGGEGYKFRHLSKRGETFLGEGRGNPVAFAHNAVNSGADLVLGHGPHVTRAMETYKGKLIAYSLGNFCTNGCFNTKSYNGKAPILKLKIDKNGKYSNPEIISIRQKRRGHPEPDPANTALQEIIKLSRDDFGKVPDGLLPDISAK